jgi:RNA polymerase sigma factor (sigma-70 family)
MLMARGPVRDVLAYVQSLAGSAGAAETSDQSLIERFARSRDETAFATLVRRHGPLVLGVCRRELGNCDDAEDAFQATFLVLARKAGLVAWRTSLGNWLHETAFRVARKLRTSNACRRARERVAAVRGESLSPAAPQREEICSVLDEELCRLPQPERSVLITCYLEGRAQDAAACQLGLPLRTLQRRLARGRELLRTRLAGHGLTFQAVLLTGSLLAEPTTPAKAKETSRSAVLFATGRGSGSRPVSFALAERASGAMAGWGLPRIAGLLLTVCAFSIASDWAEPGNEHDSPTPPTVVATDGIPSAIRAFVDLDGDPLPEGAAARLGTSRLRHSSIVNAVAFSRDGRTAISGEFGRDLVFWDVASGWRVGCRHLAAVDAIAVSGDGKTLVCSGYGGIHVLAADGTGPVKEWKTGADRSGPTPLAVSFDGKLVAAPVATTKPPVSAVGVFETDTGRKRFAFPYSGQLAGFALAPGGHTLAIACWGSPSVRLWDVNSGKETRQLVGHTREVFWVTYSPDGKMLLTASNDGTKRLWDATSGKELGQLRTGVLSPVYLPDGSTLVGLFNQHLAFVDARTGDTRFNGDGSVVGQQVTVSPDGKTVATFRGGAGAQTFDLWDAANGKGRAFPGHINAVRSLAFAPDGKTLLSTSYLNDRVRKWDTGTGRELDVGAVYNFSDVLFSPDGKTFTGFGYGTHDVSVFDASDGKIVARMGGFAGSPTCLSFEAKGPQLLEGVGFYKTARLWDVTKKEMTREFTLEQDQATEVVLSPDGTQVAAGGYNGGAVRWWNTRTGRETKKLFTTHRMVHALAFSPDGKTLATADQEGPICLWDLVTRTRVRQFAGLGRSYAVHLSFSADGKLLLGVRGRAVLWDVSSGKERTRFPGHVGNVMAAALSPDGRLAATAGADTTILVWDLTDSRPAPRELAREEMEGLWNRLNDTDDRRGYRAAAVLAAVPRQSVPFLGERLRPVVAADEVVKANVARLVADLDSDSFAEREKATASLKAIGPAAEPLIRKALETILAAETKRRLEDVHKSFAEDSPESLRDVRAVRALERIRTPEARQLLEKLASGEAKAVMTREAKTALRRLALDP